MTGWGKVIYFLIYVAINEIGNYLDQDSRYYTCPCYCDINHVHVRRENDKCKQAFQMAIQDSCSLYIVYHDDIHRVDSISYSEFSDSLSRSTISLTK